MDSPADAYSRLRGGMAVLATAVMAVLLVLFVANVSAVKTRSASVGWRQPGVVAWIDLSTTGGLFAYRVVTFDRRGKLRFVALGIAGRLLRPGARDHGEAAR